LPRRIFGGVGHDAHRVEPGPVERGPDAADAAVHHVGGGDHVAAGLGLDDGLLDQHVEGLVVDDIAVAHQPVLAVGGEGIERHVAQDADLGHRLLDRAHGAADEVVGIAGFLAVLGFQLARHDREDRDDGDAQFGRPARVLDQLVDAQPLDAGHRGDRAALGFPVLHEDGPDQVGGRQPVLGHQRPRPGMAPVAAEPRVRKTAPDGRNIAHCAPIKPDVPRAATGIGCGGLTWWRRGP
jgi:hypothetical protein